MVALPHAEHNIRYVSSQTLRSMRTFSRLTGWFWTAYRGFLLRLRFLRLAIYTSVNAGRIAMFMICFGFSFSCPLVWCSARILASFSCLELGAVGFLLQLILLLDYFSQFSSEQLVPLVRAEVAGAQKGRGVCEPQVASCLVSGIINKPGKSYKSRKQDSGRCSLFRPLFRCCSTCFPGFWSSQDDADAFPSPLNQSAASIPFRRFHDFHDSLPQVATE